MTINKHLKTHQYNISFYKEKETTGKEETEKIGTILQIYGGIKTIKYNKKKNEHIYNFSDCEAVFHITY